MAKPREFVSSTCYDLKEIRSQIREFIYDYGYVKNVKPINNYDEYIRQHAS